MKKRKIVFVMLVALIVSVFYIGNTKNINGEGSIDYANMTQQEFVDQVNSNPTLLGQVKSMLNGIYPEVINESITLEELSEAIEVANLNSYPMTLYIPGGWTYEFYSNQLVESIDEPVGGYPEFDVVTMYSPRVNTDWSWLSFFFKEDVRISIVPWYFTETDYYTLRNSNFYEVSNQQLYSVMTNGFSRIATLDISQYLPTTLLSPEYAGDPGSMVGMYGFGGRLNVNLTSADYSTIDALSETQFGDKMYVAPDGNSYSYDVYLYGSDFIVLLDNGSYLYYNEHYLEETDLNTSTRMYYTKVLMEDSHFLNGTNSAGPYPQPVALYRSDYNLIELDTSTEIQYFDQSGNAVTSTINANYLNDLAGKEFKWGGTRNVFSPLIAFSNYHFPDPSEGEVNWSVGSSNWQPLFIFAGVPGEPVTVKYEDEAGTKLSDDIVLSGDQTTPYTSEALQIPGYTLKAIPENANGVYSDVPQEVVYIYGKDESVGVTTAVVIVKYVDESGKKLSEDVVLRGNMNEPYSSNSLTISGYVLKQTPANSKGTFTEKVQEVVYVYTLKQTETVDTGDRSGNPYIFMIATLFSIAIGGYVISKKTRKE